ncbi:MAG: anti-sigma factor [Colwellia sp.]|nr:anti-sigma factor [Colwellia sp.]
MSERIGNMTNKAARYQQTNVVDHLASQFVLGTLTPLVWQRVVSLCKDNEALENRINFWQEKLVSIDQKTVEVPPHDNSWAIIAQALKIDTEAKHETIKVSQLPNEKQSLFSKVTDWWSDNIFSSSNFSVPAYRLSAAFSVVVLVLATLIVNPFAHAPEQLSYVAVLTDQQGSAHLVASTYGDSQKLVVHVINIPDIDTEQSLELWVVSKTDAQARSLGVIPQGKSLIEQQLTQAQWRLIKDSESLIVTMEEAGGSPIGEPSEVIISRGLCVRLQEWDSNA